MSTFRMTSTAAAAIVLGLGLGAPAFAQGMYGDWSGFYIGGSLGYGDGQGSVVLNDDVEGMTYGVQAGYNFDFGSYVLGGELQYVGTDMSGTTTGGGTLDVDAVTRAKLRAGYDAGAFMPYVVGGWAMLETTGAVEDSDDGYLWGVGIDYLVRDNIVLGGEVLWHEFADYADTGIDVSATTFDARISFRF